MSLYYCIRWCHLYGEILQVECAEAGITSPAENTVWKLGIFLPSEIDWCFLVFNQILRVYL
jgi:hypothetical protein